MTTMIMTNDTFYTTLITDVTNFRNFYA